MDATAQLNHSLAGRYEIDREIGRGGMATVYLARDVKHQRLVALKVLNPELGAVLGVDRFLSEIRVTANLQHTHLLPLFDSGEADGLLFYVMPFVDGETLRARLSREKQLPIDDAVKIAVAVSSALAYAHERGVIHRDLKPENILIHAGQPVVADFGIALAVSNAGGARVTQTGLSLGTPHYMSPEQASGDRVIDARSDIYALAAVTYEMLAGEPPHTGNTAQAIIAKLMTAEPRPLRELRKSVPRNVADAVEKALSKSPADRFRSATDFADALSNPAFSLSSESRPVSEGGGARPWKLLSAALSVVALGAIAVALTQRGHAPAQQPVTRFVIPLDSGAAAYTSLSQLYARFALSADGSLLVYSLGPTGSLAVRRRDQIAVTPLPGTEGALAPFFSPDGASVGFTAGTAIKIVPIAGGRPTTLSESMDGRFGAAWGADGFIYATGNERQGGLMRLAPKAGAAAQRVTTIDSAAGERLHRFPEALPNGKGVLFTVYYGADNVRRPAAIAVVDLASGKHRTLVNGSQARYASGQLLFNVGTLLLAAPFDQRTMKMTGEPVRLTSELRISGSNVTDFAASSNGMLMYATGNDWGKLEPTWVTRNGSAQAVDPGWAAPFMAPSISPDGTRLAIGVRPIAGSSEVWIKQLDRGPALKLTPERSYNNGPAWTPDGRAVTYQSDSAGTFDLWTKRADGSAPAMLQAHTTRSLSEVLWSPDGKSLIGRTALAANGEGDLLVSHPPADTVMRVLVATPFTEKNMTFSPDGRWMAYASNESGQFEVYVVPFPAASASRTLVSTAGGNEPRWSHRGGEIFYRDGVGNMVSAEVKTAPSFSLVRSTVLFSAAGYERNSAYREYDVSLDDRRFLMLRPIGASGSFQLVVVENWLEEIKGKTAKP